MGHELKPATGRLPPLDEIVERLRHEFKYVHIDRDLALKKASAYADWIERAKPAVFLGRHEQALAQAKRLRALSVNEVLWLEFGDAPALTLQFVVLPDEKIKFGYSDEHDEQRAQPLLARCARVLNCEIVLF